MDQVVLGVCCLTFNSKNWNQKQTIPMQAVEDFKVEPGVSLKLKYTWTTEQEAPGPARRQNPFDDPFGETGEGNTGVSSFLGLWSMVKQIMC